MKFKYYLRGAGVGMVVTAIIMSVSFSQIKQDSITEPVQETTNHGETVLKASGTEDDNTNVASEDLADEKSDDATDASVTDTNATDKNTSNNTETKVDDASDEDISVDAEETKTDKSESSIDNNEEGKNSEDEVTTYKVTIISGEVSKRIADRLESLGLVDDGHEFNKYLESNKLDHALRPGTYNIEKGLSYKEIADILMKK